MRTRYVAAVAGLVGAGGAAAALAAHQQIDPGTVPVGFLTAHSQVNGVPTAGLARDLRAGRFDVFIEHARLASNGTAGSGASPGPVLISVQRGVLNVDTSVDGSCVRKRLTVDTGVVLRSRQSARWTAGAEGADFYVTYLLRRRTGNHRPAAATPEGCT